MRPLPYVLSAAFLLLAGCQSQAGPPVAAGTADSRARALVAQMTLDEKIAELHGTQNKTQFRVVLGIPRLNIPDLLITNGPAGMGPAGPGHSGPATALPAPIALAATWDEDAAREYGIIAGSEAYDLGNMLLEAPDINIARTPMNGRTFEAYGEDPYLTGRMAVDNIEGIQSQGELANVKHFAANNQEASRFSIDETIDERALREIYLPAFEASVKTAHVASVMSAYNKINGAFCSENGMLLNTILKKEWGFDGFVLSDYGAVHSTVPTALNGLDLEMPSGKYWGSLGDAVTAGTVPTSVIDDKLVRRFRTMIAYGFFDGPPARKAIPAQEDGARARQIAEEAVVLLKNQGHLLPLDAKAIKSVALIGPYASKAMTGGGGSSQVDPAYTVTPLAGLQAKLGAGVNITVDDGKDVDAAVASAKAADTVILCLGDHQHEGGDHPLTLNRNQDALAAAVLAANPRTIVVLKSGGPVFMPWLEAAPAVLEVWYPGEEDGNVVADVLLGTTNPSGKLPITFPAKTEDLPQQTPEEYPGVDGHVTYSESVLVGYRWYDAKGIAPLFPFGFGLSYTTFGYSGLTVTPASNSSSGFAPVKVSFTVKNTGPLAGTEVAQVYVAQPGTAGVVQPPHQLKGFARVTLAPGASKQVEITLDARGFSYWDVGSHGWKIAPGTYGISVGTSSRNLALSATVQVH